MHVYAHTHTHICIYNHAQAYNIYTCLCRHHGRYSLHRSSWRLPNLGGGWALSGTILSWVQLPCWNMGWNGDAAIAGWFTMEHPMNIGDIYIYIYIWYFMRIYPLVHEQFDPKVSQWLRGHESSKLYLPGPMLIYWRVVGIVWFGCLWNWDIPGICSTFSRVYMMLCEPIDLWIRDSEMLSFETNPHLEVTETQHVCDHPDG